MSFIDFVESLHPRAPKGSPTGGRFVSKGGAAKTAGVGRRGVSTAQQRGAWVLDAADRREISKYRDAAMRGIAQPNFNPEQKSSIWNYRRTGTQLNFLLRASKINETEDQLIAKLDEMIDKNRLSENLILHRYYPKGLPAVEDKLRDLRPGDVFIDKAFMSTTVVPKEQMASEIHESPNLWGELKILADEGSKAAYLGINDYEVLLARNSTLEYVGHDPDDGSEVFRLRQDKAEVQHERPDQQTQGTTEKTLQGHSATVTVYHGTTISFEKLQLPKVDQWNMLDRLLGVHVAENEKIAETFVTDWQTKQVKEGGRILPLKLDSSKFLQVEQRQYPGGLESDQSAMQHMIMKVAYRADPEMLSRYLVQARAVPESDAPKLAEAMVAGEKVTLPVDGPNYTLDRFVENFGGAPYDVKDRAHAVELARKEWQRQGYQGLKYTNTSPMETEGIQNKTCYVVFDPKTLTSSFDK
jgi:hypothetical protein